MMDIRPIRSQADYDAALERIDALMGAGPGTPEGDELDVLTTIVEAYEQKHFVIEAPDPIEFIRNTMEFMGIEQNDLADILKSRSRASEILNRRRALTLSQIRQITSALHIPADSLITEYKLAQSG